MVNVTYYGTVGKIGVNPARATVQARCRAEKTRLLLGQRPAASTSSGMAVLTATPMTGRSGVFASRNSEENRSPSS
jgi:hypothetical protein